MHMSISSDFKLGLTKHQCRKLMESVHVRIKFKWHLDDFWFQIWNLRGLKYFQMTLTADPGLCSSNLTMDLAFSMSILAPWFCFKYLGTVYPWRRPTTPVFEGGWYTWYIHSYIPGSNAICTYSKWLTWHGWIPMSKVAQNLLVFLGIRKFWIATGRSGRYGFESNSRACGNFGDLHKVAKSLLHFPGIWSYHVIPFDDVHQKRCFVPPASSRSLTRFRDSLQFIFGRLHTLRFRRFQEVGRWVQGLWCSRRIWWISCWWRISSSGSTRGWGLDGVCGDTWAATPSGETWEWGKKPKVDGWRTGSELRSWVAGWKWRKMTTAINLWSY